MIEFSSDDWGDASIRHLLNQQISALRDAPQSFVEPIIPPGMTEDYAQLDIAASYSIGGKQFNDMDFFDELVNRQIPVADLLRELYLTYYSNPNAPRNLSRWDGRGTTMSSLGQVARAAVLLDFNQSDLMRAHFRNRDDEHDTYTSDVLLRDYASKYRWTSEVAQRVGLVWCSAAWLGNPGTHFWRYGLARAAEKMMTPARFFALFLQEFHGLGLRFSRHSEIISFCLDVPTRSELFDRWELPSDFPNEFDNALLAEALKVCPQIGMMEHNFEFIDSFRQLN